jgi:hypothetical protein
MTNFIITSSLQWDFETFYGNLKSKFPRIRQLSVWNEWDWSNKGDEGHGIIMSALATEMIRWAENGEYEEVKKFLDEIENAWSKANESVLGHLGTDFIVTIIDCENKPVRENIKKLMAPETTEAYQISLRGYKEPD